MLLVSGATAAMRRIRDPRLGRLIVPASGNIPDELPWACDNGAFSGFDEQKFTRMLERLAPFPGCLWVACPDVVADCAGTLALFDVWEPRISAYGFPVALVAQDGLTSDAVPWDRIACLFIGGSTDWKLSWESHALCLEAKRRGKWVHIGRVNSARRFVTARQMCADSIDGTAFSRFSDIYIPKALEWFDAQEPQGSLFQ